MRAPIAVQIKATGRAQAIVAWLDDGVTVATLANSAGITATDVTLWLQPKVVGVFKLWAKAVDFLGACAQTGAVRIVTVEP